MSLLFSDGFDISTLLTDKWDSVQSSNCNPAVINSTAGRNGGGAMYSPGGSTSNFTCGTRAQKSFGTQSTVFVGFALYWDPTPQTTNITDYVVLSLLDGGSTQVDLRITQSGVFYLTRNGTTIATATQSYSARVFHYVEVGVVFSGTVGTATLKIDGVTWASASGVNTIATSNAYASAIYLGVMSVQSGNSNWAIPKFVIDDVYINNAAGSSFNTYLGDVNFKGLLPTGNGTLQDFTTVIASVARSTVYAVGATVLDTNSAVQRCTSVTSNATSSASNPTWSTTNGGATTDGNVTWTRQAASAAAYLAVNEPVSDGDSSYVYDATVGHQEAFTFPAVTSTGILGIAVYANIKKDTSGARAFRTIAKSGGTVADNGADILPGSSYAVLSGVIQNDPATGSAWTASGVSAAEFGIKIVS